MKKLTHLWHGLRSECEERWLAFNTREQRILSLLAVVTAVWLVYNLVVSPVLSAKDRSAKRLQASENTYQQASDRAGKIVKLLAAGNQLPSSKPSSASLDSRISASAKRFSIPVSSLNLQNQVVTLRLAPIKFTVLTQWLIAMDKQNITVINLDMVAGKTSGIVEVRQLQLKDITS